MKREEIYQSSRNANGGRRWIQRRKPEAKPGVLYTGEYRRTQPRGKMLAHVGPPRAHCNSYEDRNKWAEAAFAAMLYGTIMRVNARRIGTAHSAGCACCMKVKGGGGCVGVLVRYLLAPLRGESKVTQRLYVTHLSP
jgi:hypothetical protein